MKPRGTILKRIRFSSKNIVVFRVKYKIKVAEESFDLFFYETSLFLPTILSECRKKYP